MPRSLAGTQCKNALCEGSTLGGCGRHGGTIALESAPDLGVHGRAAIKERADATAQDIASHQDAALAASADDADVGADAHDVPVHAAAGVLATHTKHVADSNIEDHAVLVLRVRDGR